MARKIVYVDRNAMRGFTVKIERLRGLRLWFRGLCALTALFFQYNKVRRAYDKATPEITSGDFWRRRLGKASK